MVSTVKVAAPAPPPPPGKPDPFEQVVRQAMDNVRALTVLADNLAATEPAVARHVRELAAEVAHRTLASLRRWPV